MKLLSKLLAALLFTVSLTACRAGAQQQINLNGSPPQVKGVLQPANGGSGTAPTTADTLLRSTAANAASYTPIPNCPADGVHALVYSTSAHLFTCANITGGGGGGGGVPGATGDVPFNGGSGLFAADTGLFFYNAGSHTLGTQNQALTGTFQQNTTDTAGPFTLANASTTAPPGGATSQVLFSTGFNYGPGMNVGNPFGYSTNGSGWRVLVAHEFVTNAGAAGISQNIHLICDHHGSGDTACIYQGNGQGFTPGIWSAASDEGTVGINMNGTQFACIPNGTITSTSGTHDRTPVFHITGANCNGSNALISDGIVMDLSAPILTTNLVGSNSGTAWESNPLGIGLLPVTASTAVATTGMCVTTADIPPSTVLDVYQTQTLACPIHDSKAIVASSTVAVMVASAGGPEQCFVLTYNSGTGAGTISCAKEHPIGSYIFQGGTQGFGDFVDDITVLGLHSAVYVVGAPDTRHLLIAEREAGQFRGGPPILGGEPAALTLTGQIVVYPGALCTITNSNNTQCTLEANNIPWANGHTWTNPTGLVTLEALYQGTSTQSAPDNPSAHGFGVGVIYASTSNHSLNPMFFGFNAASYSKYMNSGSGTGWLTAPPGIQLMGPTGNALLVDSVISGGGTVPCGGAAFICYKNALASNTNNFLYANAQGADNILIDHVHQQFLFSWGVSSSASTSSFANLGVSNNFTIGSVDPTIPANNGSFLFNGINPGGTNPFLIMSQCGTINCSPSLDGSTGHLSVGKFTGSDMFVGARVPSLNTLFVSGTHGTSTVCYTGTYVTTAGETTAFTPSCLTDSFNPPNNFIAITTNAGAQSIKIYRTTGGATQGVICVVTPATPFCTDSNLTADGTTPPTVGTSGTQFVDGLLAVNVFKINAAATSSTTASDHSLPIKDSTGTTYYIRVSATP